EVDAALICEPEENEICLFQKGALRVSVTFKGVMSHGAMPYAGVNPITALTRFVNSVMQYQQAEQDRLGKHEHLGFPWLTPTIIEAAVACTRRNGVNPGRARLELDSRAGPGQEHDEIISVLQGFARELEAEESRLSVDVDCFESRPWTQTPEDDPIV